MIRLPGTQTGAIHCLTLLCLLTTVFSTHAGVIGSDDRRLPVAAETQLVSALGHIVCAKVVNGVRRRSAGTGTIVGNRHTVLTAAHVFADSAGRRGPQVKFDAAADCVFRQYDSDGNVTAEVAFLYSQMGAFRDNPAMPNADWAVLRTVTSLPESANAVKFANDVSAFEQLDGLAIKILAYHADIESARRLPLVSEGELQSIEYGGYARLAHTADIGRMSSGAAIVYTTNAGEHVVVGVNRSSANLGEFNLAVPLSLELEGVLRSYVQGRVPIHQQRVAAN